MSAMPCQRYRAPDGAYRRASTIMALLSVPTRLRLVTTYENTLYSIWLFLFYLLSMPKYDLFKALPLFAYVDRVHIRYRPGSPNSDTCRRLLMNLSQPETKCKFPLLSYTYELLSYDDRPEIAITLSSNVSHRFYADECSLEDIHRAIDSDQYKAHINYLKSKSLEAARE